MTINSKVICVIKKLSGVIKEVIVVPRRNIERGIPAFILYSLIMKKLPTNFYGIRLRDIWMKVCGGSGQKYAENTHFSHNANLRANIYPDPPHTNALFVWVRVPPPALFFYKTRINTGKVKSQYLCGSQTFITNKERQ